MDLDFFDPCADVKKTVSFEFVLSLLNRQAGSWDFGADHSLSIPKINLVIMLIIYICAVLSILCIFQ
jgi:uncharacterized protein involved in cysteine biosynthesis